MPRTCPLCRNLPYKNSMEGFCYHHYLVNIFRHNDDIDHLGIVSFAFTMFPTRFRTDWGVARMHREMLWEFLYDEPTWQREDRAHVIATYRHGSKTTWFSFVIPTYFVCLTHLGIYVGDYKLPVLDYLVLKSKTGKAAQKNLYNIQNALRSREIMSLFGDLRATITEQKQKTGKDTSALMITSNSVIVESLGINQQIRGTNILGKRPKIVVYDDPETIENTKTPERRKNNEMDLLDETWGAIDDQDGRLVYIGNMVHGDCLLFKLLGNPKWKRKFYTLTYKPGMTSGIGSEGELITWPRKYTYAGIKKLKEFYNSHPLLGLVAFYRNYYNINKTDVNPVVNKVTRWEYLYHDNLNWIRYIDANNFWVTERVYITVGYDAAVTQRSYGSKTSIVALAQTPSKKKFVLEYQYGIFDVHDRYVDGYPEKERPIVAVEPSHLAKLLKRGGIEESVRMVLKYHADGFAMGTEGQQLGFYNDVVDLMNRVGVSCPCMPIAAAGQEAKSKVTRLKDWVLRQFEAGVFWLCGDMYELVSEIDSFPQSKLDILDSIYYADKVQLLTSELEYGASPSEIPVDVILPSILCEEKWTAA